MRPKTPARSAGLRARLRWAAGAAGLTLREPRDGIDRVLVRARNAVGIGSDPGEAYAPDADWQRRLHESLGVPWPCVAIAEFDRLWREIVQRVETQGLSLGRGTYGGWDDADPGLARAVWCLTLHLAPRKVVETGVARGVTSTVILEALSRTGPGTRLWSVDLPSMDPTLHHEIGAAVPCHLRSRWTYIKGTARRRLPSLLADLRPIDLFVHDSSHTERNLRFELEQAWGAIERGVIVADDVHQSPAFARFAQRLDRGAWLVADADDGGARFGVALKGL